jgi:hypothetical protein
VNCFALTLTVPHVIVVMVTNETSLSRSCIVCFYSKDARSSVLRYYIRGCIQKFPD